MGDGRECTPQQISDGIGVAYITVGHCLRMLTRDGVLVMRKRVARNPSGRGGKLVNVYRLLRTLDCTPQEWEDNADDDECIGSRGPVDPECIRQSALQARTPLECAWMGQL